MGRGDNRRSRKMVQRKNQAKKKARAKALVVTKKSSRVARRQKAKSERAVTTA